MQQGYSIVNYGGFCVDYDPYLPVNNLSVKNSLTSYYELEFYFEDWEGGIYIDNTLYPIKQGFFSCSKPGQIRKMKRPYRCYYLNLIPHNEALKKALKALPICAFHAKWEEIIALCKQMYQIKERHTLPAQLRLDSLVSMILCLLLEHQYTLPNTSEANALRHQAVLLEADAYLRNHIGENVDLDKLAQSSHLHPTYFHKMFKAAFGHTPVQRLLMYRMIAAKDLLSAGNLPISEIAGMCGFSSQNYFTYKFKEKFGHSPSQYRKKSRKKSQ